MGASGTATPRYDTVVVGGGIVGCAIAYNLARRGQSVCILESRSIGSQQSSRAWGFIRQQGRHSAEIPLAAEASRMWGGLERELQADLEFVRSGILLCGETPADEERLETARAAAVASGVHCERVAATEIGRLVPGSVLWKHGLFTPGDAHAEPALTTRAFAAAALRAGAEIKEGVEVDGIDVAQGAVSGVVAGERRFAADAVVCAAGVSSKTFLRRIAVHVPIQPVRAPVSQTEPTAYRGAVPVWSPHVAFRPKRDGSFYVGNGYREIDAEYDLGLHTLADLAAFWPTFLQNWRVVRPRFGREALGILARQIRGRHADPPDHEPRLSQALIERNLSQFHLAMPGIGHVPVQRSWAGRIDATPDLIPILDRAGPRGLYVAAGFNGHGFALAPCIGTLLAEWIVEGRPHLDLSAFRLGRFADGEAVSEKSAL